MDSGELDLPLIPLLKALPGETLFSLCSRQHRLWGHAQAEATGALLFGKARVGTQHDIPSCLDRLAIRTRGQWGDAATLARKKTLLRYYEPFIDEQLHEQALDSMRAESVAHLKFRLGLLTSRFRANHPLKACRACMREDRREHGWAYWHLEHQYPGVWVCPRHGGPLLQSLVKATGVGRFHWFLPDDVALRSSDAWPPVQCTQELFALSRFVCHVVECRRPIGWMRAVQVARVIEAQFAHRGWFTGAGRVRIAGAARDWLGYCQRLQGPDELRRLPDCFETARTQLGRLRRSLDEGTHPLRLMVWLCWLHRDADGFELALQAATSDASEAPAVRVSEVSGDDTFDVARRTVVEGIASGQSARAAAARAGVDVTTAMAWAASAGVATSRRPKLLSGHRLNAVLEELSRGDEKAAVAARHGISVQTVTRLLRTEVGLHVLWRQARWRTAQANARNAWTELQQSHPGVGTKLLRALDPSAYAWLYRHDRRWLQECSPTRQPLPVSLRRSSVNWPERDRALKLGVERVVLQLGLAKPGRRLRLWEIYQAYPDLKPKLRSLHLLPLTREALERALDRRMPCRSDDTLFP